MDGCFFCSLKIKALVAEAAAGSVVELVAVEQGPVPALALPGA